MEKHIHAIYKTIYSIILCCLATSTLPQEKIKTNFHERSPYILTFFVEPKKISQKDLTYEELQEKIRKPGRLARSLYKQQLRNTLNQGLYATYAGMCTHSDHTGQITFPRKTQEADFYFVVTKKINPIFLKNRTIHHFIINKKADASLYHIERKHDAQQQSDYWKITPKKIPTNRRIPNNGIVLHANPQQIYIPKTALVSSNRQNLVLPTIYTTKYITPEINALTFLKINKYFAPVRFSYKKALSHYATMTLD